jgi:glutaredoxin
MALRHWVLIGAIAFGARQWHQASNTHGVSASSAAELRQLATSVKHGEVVIYTTTHCPYCAEAKAWMTQYGFAYSECDTEVSSSCASELSTFGGTGVPYLVVRGHHMRDGFDSDEFVAALRT